MAKIRIAGIGLGGYGRRFAEALIEQSQAGRVEVAALVDTAPPPDLPRYLEALAGDKPAYYTDDEAMLAAHAGLDAVTICTPIYLHEQMVIRALEAGCHVLCAKPATTTVQSADRMIAAARKADRHVLIDFQHVYAHATQQIKQAIADGRLGAIKTVVVKMLWPRPDRYYQRNPGAGRIRLNGNYVLDGPLANPHSHYILNALYFAHPGRDGFAAPVDIQAELYHCRAIECEDTASIRCRTDTGVEILMYSSLCGEVTDDVTEMEICGERGRAVWHFTDYRIETDEGDTGWQPSVRGATEMVLQRFIDVLNGCARSQVGLADARQQVLFLNGAYEAAGPIHTIDASYLGTVEERGDRFRFVTGLHDTVERAAADRCLFSEAGVPWAEPVRPAFNLTGYRQFDLFKEKK